MGVRLHLQWWHWDWETDEYKAAVSYVRDLMQMGVFPPDMTAIPQSRQKHADGHYAVAIDGYGNSMADLWRRCGESMAKEWREWLVVLATNH